MDFGFNEQQDMLRDEWRKFLEQEVPIQRAREIGEAGRFDPALWAQMAELGWTALVIPEEHGGLGLGLIDVLVLAEELGRSCQPGLLLSTTAVAMVLAEQGSETQKAKWLPKVAAGECRATWAHYDSEADWSVDEVALVAEQSADEGATDFVLSGTKRLVADAVDADLMLVSARTATGPRLFLVPTTSSGLEIKPHVGLDLTRTFAEVNFDGVAVEADAVLPGGAAEMERALQIEIVLLCGRASAWLSR